MADNFFDDPAFEDLFEDLADFAAPLALSTSLTSSFAPPFVRLSSLPSSDFPGFNRRNLPSIASTFGPWASSSTTPAARFGIAPLPPCPAHPANRSLSTPRYPPPRNSVPQSTLPVLPLPTIGTSTATSTNPFSRPAFSFPTIFGATTLAAHPSSDDYYLHELATRDFSSPSAFNQSFHDTGTRANPAGPSRSSAAGPSSNSESRTGGSSYVKREEPSDDESAPAPSASRGDAYMPTIRSRPKRESAGSQAIAQVDGMSFPGSTSTRRNPGRRQSLPQEEDQTTRKRKRDEPVKIEDDDFGSDAFRDIIDLANTEEVPEIVKPKKSKKEVRLNGFQCVICMDDVTDLTVTHCGHLFCGECLHSSLQIDQHKKICPICRQKIDSRPASGKFGQKAKGYYPLQLRLTTRKSLGKRADRP